MHLHETTGLSCLLSGNDAIKMLELVHLCLSCHMEKDFIALFPKIQEFIPFENAIALLGYCNEHDGVVAVHNANISFPGEWLREYKAKNYLQADSVVIENFSTYNMQNWSVARKDRYRNKEITSLGMDFGMRECCTHGVKPMLMGNYGSMFCFAGDSMACDARHRAVLDIIIPHLHLVLSNIYNKEILQNYKAVLSVREKEVIAWLKHGKSSWDMSVILGISERTVNFHVRNIMHKLGVVNRAQAVAVAARQGLIDIS